jgi:FixJ family two-component response regulator
MGTKTAHRRAIAMTGPTVFVIDDNAGVRKSLQALIEATGLAAETYASGRESLRTMTRSEQIASSGRRLRGRRPGCRRARRRNATLPIIVMTGYADAPIGSRPGRPSISCRKPLPPKKLIAQIHNAIEIDRRTRAAAAQRGIVADRIAQLTPRERQVMELLAVGHSSKEIATSLGSSVRTVEGHRRTVLRKMGVDSAVQLARAITGLQRP